MAEDDMGNSIVLVPSGQAVPRRTVADYGNTLLLKWSLPFAPELGHGGAHTVITSVLAFAIQIVDDAWLRAEVTHLVFRIVQAQYQSRVSQGVVFPLNLPMAAFAVLWRHGNDVNGSSFKP